MLLLASTSDALSVVTSAASSIEVHVSYVDLTTSNGAVTPGRTNTIITTATTTTVCAAPASGVIRNIRGISITNNNSTTSSQVEVRHTDGTRVIELMGITLLPGENCIFTEEGAWKHFDVQGAEYTYSGPPTANIGATGTIAETMPRETCPETNTAAGSSGTLFMQAIYLKAGQLVSSITIWSATTAASGSTNRFFALYDVNRNLLAQSANDGANAWAAQSAKTLPMTTAYRVPVSGVYYIGLLQVATTAIATIKGGATRSTMVMAAATPVVAGTSTSGLTTSLPNPAGAITAGTASIYAAVS